MTEGSVPAIDTLSTGAPAAQALNAVESPASPPAAPAAWYSSYDEKDQGVIAQHGWATENGHKDMFGAYKHLLDMRGVPAEQLLKLPAKEAEAKEWDAVYDRLGRPKTAAEYNYKAPEGVQLDLDRMGSVTEAAHAAGLNSAQLSTILDAAVKWESDKLAQIQREQDQKDETELRKLERDWGSTAKTKTEYARQALERCGADGEVLGILQDALGKAGALRFFANIGERFQEASFPSAGNTFGTKNSDAVAPMDAKMERNKLVASIQSDAKRFQLYKSGKGEDYERMARLIELEAEYTNGA